MKKLIPIILIFLTTLCHGVRQIPNELKIEDLPRYLNPILIELYNMGTVSTKDVVIKKIFQEITRVENKTIITRLGDIIVNQDNLYANGLRMLSDGTLHTGVGNYANSDTPFYVDADGRLSLKDKLYFDGTDLTVEGSITASVLYSSAGYIGGFEIHPSSLTTTNDEIVMDSANKRFKIGTMELNGTDSYLKDDSYVKDRKGLYLSPEYSQLNNASILGELIASVYKVNALSGVGGKLIVSNASNMAIESGADRLTYKGDYLTYNGDYLTYNGTEIHILSNVFSSNTVVAIQTEIGGDILSEYMLVTDTGTYVSVSTHTVAQGYYYTYTVVRDIEKSGTRHRFPPGTGVISTGKPDEGYIVLDAQSSNNPFMQVLKRNTTNYDDVDAMVTLGNLDAAESDVFSPTGYGIHTQKGYFEGEIKASTMTTSNMSSINLTASNIESTSITASTMIAGSTSGSHTIIDSSGIKSYDTAGSTTVFQVLTSGTDVGDVIIGSTNTAYIKFDASNSSVTIVCSDAGITYNTEQTRKYSIAASDVVPNYENQEWNIGVNSARSGHDTDYAEFAAPFHLPNDSIITAITVYYYRTDESASAHITPQYVNFSNGTINSMCSQIYSDSSSGYHSVTETSFSGNTIDNDTYSYSFQIFVNPNDSAFEVFFIAAVIEYTITEPLP